MKPPKSVVAQVLELMKRPKVRGSINRADENITKASVPLNEFVAILYEEGGSAYKTAKRLGVAHTVAAARRRWIEEELGIELPRGKPEIWKSQAHRRKIDLTLDNATILCGSDLHAWPEIYGVAMAAFVDFNRRLKPDIVLLNGDGFDGAQISRHSRLGWDKRPSPAEEIEALSEYLETLRKVNPNARYIRTRGNHDTRLETYLASHASLIEGVAGTSLADHLPGWEECITVHVNYPECTIKHRGRHSGIHATFNELRALGASFVHGHLHSQKLVTFENAHGSVYGVDLGMLSPKDHPGFDYVEADCMNWRSGFAVLTFADSRLDVPELATVTDEERGILRFRGGNLTYHL